MDLLRAFGKFVLFVLAFAGLIALAYLFSFGPRASQAYGAPDFSKSFVAPDGRMRAMLLNYNGGGAISPYCYDVVSVLPASAPDAQAGHERFEVFSGECDSFELNEAIRTIEKSPIIEWL